jgi:hypothetical protein
LVKDVELVLVDAADAAALDVTLLTAMAIS